jgi:hypothetical protein
MIAAVTGHESIVGISLLMGRESDRLPLGLKPAPWWRRFPT